VVAARQAFDEKPKRVSVAPCHDVVAIANTSQDAKDGVRLARLSWRDND
jgi:hypothetical protein